jgi:hypothetical protein
LPFSKYVSSCVCLVDEPVPHILVTPWLCVQRLLKLVTLPSIHYSHSFLAGFTPRLRDGVFSMLLGMQESQLREVNSEALAVRSRVLVHRPDDAPADGVCLRCCSLLVTASRDCSFASCLHTKRTR